MSEQTLLSRIGGWFKRGQREEGAVVLDNDNGQPDNDLGRLSSSNALSGPVESRSTFLRPWAKRDAAIENVQNGVGALADLMGGIREHLEKQSKRQDELLQYLSHLPQALQSLPENTRQQSETLKAIHQQMERQHEKQSQLADILERITQADSQHGRSLDALQDRVETLNEHDAKISENLSSVGAAMQAVGKHSETSAQVLQQLRDNIDNRDGELERVLHHQGTRFTTLLAIAIFLSIAALVAVGIIGYLGYEALSRAR